MNKDKIIEIANNAIYFNDSSDYLTALWEICMEDGMEEDEVGKSFYRRGVSYGRNKSSPLHMRSYI